MTLPPDSLSRLLPCEAAGFETFPPRSFSVHDLVEVKVDLARLVTGDVQSALAPELLAVGQPGRCTVEQLQRLLHVFTLWKGKWFQISNFFLFFKPSLGTGHSHQAAGNLDTQSSDLPQGEFLHLAWFCTSHIPCPCTPLCSPAGLLQTQQSSASALRSVAGQRGTLWSRPAQGQIFSQMKN